MHGERLQLHLRLEPPLLVDTRDHVHRQIHVDQRLLGGPRLQPVAQAASRAAPNGDRHHALVQTHPCVTHDESDPSGVRQE